MMITQNMSKRIVSILLAAFILVSCLPISAEASVIAWGDCGNGITWELSDSGTLTISGNGDMENYYLPYNASQGTNAPWASYAEQIQNVVINSGVTSIGDLAFALCRNLSSATLPEGITYIGEAAFYMCSLTSVNIPDTVEYIGSEAFSFCKMDSITIPESVSEIERNAFFCCKKLSKITFKGNAPKHDRIGIFSEDVHATAYYPEGNDTWTDYAMETLANDGNITWVSYSNQISNTPDTKALPEDYVGIIQQTIDNLLDISWADTGYGALYDLDQNGIDELILVYTLRNEPYVARQVCSAYTMSNNKAVCLIDEEVLYGEAGGPSGHVAVVRDNGELRLALTGETGETGAIGDRPINRGGFWKLYEVKGSSAHVKTNVEYDYYRSNGDIQYNKSTSVFNGQKRSYEEYETWRDSLEEILMIHPYGYRLEDGEYMTLEQLLEYLNNNPIEDSSSTTEDLSLPEQSGEITTNSEVTEDTPQSEPTSDYHFRLYSPNQELSVDTGKLIQIICKFYCNGELVSNWEQPSISVGNSDILSYVACQAIDDGYCITLQGISSGIADITLWDKQSDTSLSFTIGVTDSSSAIYSGILNQIPSGYPKTKWDSKILTNYYNINGLYVTGLEKHFDPQNGVYHVNFNVYNTKYMHGSVDVYTKDGQWIKSVQINKHANVRGVWDVLESTYYSLCNITNVSFTAPEFSQETIVNIEVPEGGYFKITNNYYESPAVYLYNGIDYLIFAANKTLDYSLDSECIKEIQDKTIKMVIESPKFRAMFEESILKRISQTAVDASGNMLKIDLVNTAGRITTEMVEFLKACEIDIWDIVGSSTDIAADIFKSLLPDEITAPLDFMFLTSEVTDLVGQLDNIVKSYRKPQINIYTPGACGKLTMEGVTAIPAENALPSNAVLNVSKIYRTDTLSIPELNVDINEYKMYDISYSSSNIDVQPNGNVEINIPIPREYGWKEYAVLHQQEEGSWELLESKIEDNTIVFTVDHFSLFVVVDGCLVTSNTKSNHPTALHIILFSIVIVASLLILIILKKKNSNTPTNKGLSKTIFAFTIVGSILVACYFTIHFWSDATCTDAETCKLCGKERGAALGHDWQQATCTEPSICIRCEEVTGTPAGHHWANATCTKPSACLLCGETTGDPIDHQWMSATCTDPEKCSGCGTINAPAWGHTWNDATCTQAPTCRICGIAEGTPLGHQWTAATYASPKTCVSCGATEGTRLFADPIYLNELGVMSGHVGKVWTRSSNDPSDVFHTRKNPNWDNWDVPGHTAGTVRDNGGNERTYAIFIDGDDSQTYYMEFHLDGKYVTFSGYCASPDKQSAVSKYVHNSSTMYSKYFEVYGDGRYIGKSSDMRYDFAPKPFEFNVTGVDVLRIVYPESRGPNEIASIYDGLLE